MPGSKNQKNSKKSARKNTRGEKSQNAKGDFYVVGVGGSAGGLPAFIELLQNIPTDAGMAFVIVQHLLADAKSNLSEILSVNTELPVKEVLGDTPVLPNHVYVIPPNKNIVLKDNKLHLSPRARGGLNLSIDEFFVSLAKGKKQNSIGVILSGTGSDGTLGMKAIREVGGIAFVQDKSAAFPAMPQSVVAAGFADYILNPTKIAEKLVIIASDSAYYFGRGDEKDSYISKPEEKDFSKILKLLLDSSDVDFTYYKQGTLKRRIMRRMSLKDIANFTEYVEYLQKNPKEVESLYQDILIKVTNFFRDQSVFNFLKLKILPEIFKHEPQSVRVWVPGCSTGEEVYSLAITLTEFMEKQNRSVPVQIFGTDLSETALNTARSAFYPKSIESNVPSRHLDKFFTKRKDGYEVNASVRAMCIFSKHNVVRDIPFTKMDIVSCRNVLIYLDSMLQKKAFPIFHYALKPKGFLILGTAETVATFRDLFSEVDRKQKVYSKKTTPSPPLIDFSLPNPPTSKEIKSPEIELISIENKADKIVLSRHAPAGVIVNDDLAIVQFRGDVSRYLKHPSGRATLDLIKMVHRTLLAKLLDMIEKVRKNGITVKSAHSGLKVNVEVIPLGGHSTQEKHYLILFEETGTLKGLKDDRAGKGDERAMGVLQADEELSSTIDQLQSLIETRDTANEELRSAHEEVMSANEELQSTNEELETTKEELQSTNEELATLNSELQHRNSALLKVEESHKKMAPRYKVRGEELRRKDEFISILGHELRNPLAPIINSLELANLHGIKDPELKHLIGVIERHAKLLNNIVNGLLDAARAMSGKIELRLEHVDFNTVVKNAIETTEVAVKAREHRLEFFPSKKPIRMALDPLRVEQIIINLIDNATKYTLHRGEINIKVTQEDDKVALSVKDNGIGISEEMLPKVFGLFSQSAQPLNDFKGGLGVGLMLARTLSELHDGSLTASSSGLGKGSEFILELPIKEDADNLHEPAEERNLRNGKLKKMKIIVVDDNAALADLIGKVLTILNQDVTVTYDGPSAIAVAKVDKPNIVFIDISMPAMSGYELIKILRKDLGLKKTKMIAFSGFGEEYGERTKDAGFDGHLTKPVSIKDMQKLLAKLGKEV
ncbi:MAG: CheR family methyltransferase [bacterium]|nr:CheR family methyltransferase [bacterium]